MNLEKWENYFSTSFRKLRMFWAAKKRFEENKYICIYIYIYFIFYHNNTFSAKKKISERCLRIVLYIRTRIQKYQNPIYDSILKRNQKIVLSLFFFSFQYFPTAHERDTMLWQEMMQFTLN